MKEFEDLCDIVEKEYGITKNELTSKIRIRPIVELRGICSNIICKEAVGYGLGEIGEKMNVDHATIIHYKKTHEQLYGTPSGKSYTEKFDLLLKEYRKRQLTFYTLSELLHKKNIIEKTIQEEIKQKGKINDKQKMALDHNNLIIKTCQIDVSTDVLQDFLDIFNAQYNQNFSISAVNKIEKTLQNSI